MIVYGAKTGVSFQAVGKGNIDIVLNALWPNSKPPVEGKHATTLSRQTTRVAEEILRDICSIILSCKDSSSSFSFTSDMWRNRSLDSFISLTMSFITEEGALVKLVPFCEYFKKRKHTGKNIKIALEDMFKALGVDEDKFEKYILLDNASNNKLEIKLSPGLNGIWCNIHIIQLSVRDTVNITARAKT